MHAPKNKFALKKKAPRLIEGTMGNLTQKERDAIMVQIGEGWSNGHILFGEAYSLSFNLIVTRISQN